MSTGSLNFTLKDYRSDNSAYTIKSSFVLSYFDYLEIQKNYSIYENLN